MKTARLKRDPLFVQRWERELLNGYVCNYPAAVEHVAAELRPRFESGDLRGWTEEDFEKKPHVTDPLTRLEDECARRYVRTPFRALAVLQFSPHISSRNPGEGDGWHWENGNGGTCLRSVAADAMAKDVLQYAREHGWSKPQRGEHPAFKGRRVA